MFRTQNGKLLAAAVLATTVATAGCGGGTGGSAGVAGDTLTIVQPGAAPLTLDPAKNGQSWAVTLGYEPLIVLKNDGSLAPGLAASWSYTGKDNTTFVLELRPGVKFADGSPLTAQSVVNDLRYKQKAQGPWGAFLEGDEFEATGPLTVTIKSAKPNPNLPEELTQNYNLGAVISPRGLADPAKLGTQTFGAGPYTLDTAATTTGDHYTYKPNPNYHDPKAVHWKRIVVKIVPNAQSVLNAVKTGQADVALGDPATMAAAGQAGLTVSSAPYLWVGVVLADREGKLVKPLGDARVRQALNLATDRASIAAALFPGAGSPTQQITVPGGHGYDPNLDRAYPYDVAKAKRLLAEAGHPSGFAMQVVTTEVIQQHLVAQALAQQWKRIGVTLTVKDHANAKQYDSAAFSGKAEAFTTAFGQLPIWIEGPILFAPSAFFNPLHTRDARLKALMDRQAKASGAERAALDRQIMGHLTTQAWFVPVVSTVLPIYARKTVTGTRTSANSPQLNVYEIRPA